MFYYLPLIITRTKNIFLNNYSRFKLKISKIKKNTNTVESTFFNTTAVTKSKKNCQIVNNVHTHVCCVLTVVVNRVYRYVIQLRSMLANI